MSPPLSWVERETQADCIYWVIRWRILSEQWREEVEARKDDCAVNHTVLYECGACEL